MLKHDVASEHNAIEVTSVDFSPTGDSVASHGDDGTVRIWLASNKQDLDQDSDTSIKRADYFASINKWEKVSRILSNAIKLNEENPQLLVARGDMSRRQSKWAGASI
jgi:WD40 repeat protein